MYFYEYIYILSYILIYSPFSLCTSNPDLRISQGGLVKISPCAVGLQFLVDVNNTSEYADYNLELIPDRCCLNVGDSVDCAVLETVGSCSEVIAKGGRTTLKLIAPILDPYDRHGYCTAYVDSKTQKRHTFRNPIKIPFDTRINSKQKNDDLKVPFGVKACKRVDEDPLDDCKPVDCEVFYNGQKSFYNRRLKKCVEVPKCLSASDEEMPSTLYDPNNNACINEEPITQDDINYVKDLTHKHGRIVKDIVIIKKFEDKPSKTDVYNFENAENTLKNYHKLYSKDKNKDGVGFMTHPQKTKMKCWWECILDYLRKNEAGLLFIALLVILQCCLIMMMVYFLSRKCLCQPTDVEDKFFNYRQDASVTTPLIGTTNVETETTCQFMSESSNVERKIQCYKACQKENAKVSMSDDILSKCLNRRNWDHKQVKSEAVDISKFAFKQTEEANSPANFETLYVSTKKQTDPKLSVDNERETKSSKEERKPKVVKSIVKKTEAKKSEVKAKRKELADSEIAPSEQEIKCYNYSEIKMPKPDSEREIKCHSYNYMIDSENLNHQASRQSYKQKVTDIYRTENRESKTNIIEKGQASAQASFSNDSIDDLLSERGVLFLTEENISDTSKYSFSNGSVRSISSMSSKTSKNVNIVKSVLSYFKKGGKSGPLSDTGGKKSKENINLELLHKSRASMYSSGNDGECVKIKSRLKDSRTSL